jgi:hypothetical protein
MFRNEMTGFWIFSNNFNGSYLEGASLSTERVEVVPDWFSKRREKKEEFTMSAEENQKHERVELYRKHGLSEEEIVQREKEKDLIFN